MHRTVCLVIQDVFGNIHRPFCLLLLLMSASICLGKPTFISVYMWVIVIVLIKAKCRQRHMPVTWEYVLRCHLLYSLQQFYGASSDFFRTSGIYMTDYHNTAQGYRFCFLVSSVFTATNLIFLSPCFYRFKTKKKLQQNKTPKQTNKISKKKKKEKEQKKAFLCLKPQNSSAESQCDGFTPAQTETSFLSTRSGTQTRRDTSRRSNTCRSALSLAGPPESSPQWFFFLPINPCETLPYHLWRCSAGGSGSSNTLHSFSV